MRSIFGKLAVSATVAFALLISTATAHAQFASTSLQGYGLKIFRVESGAYPFVQAYIRTFDQNMDPLVNLNELNIGVMVAGKAYDVRKKQYMVQSIANREETIRSVLVMDTSKTMAGAPFEHALEAAARFIDSKRPRDQVGIIATLDSPQGYEIVSNFEREKDALGRRLADLSPNGQTTRLYDAIGAGMQMCGTSGQGSVPTSGSSDYIASCSIVVMSDGKDEGSALERVDLMTRITNFQTPVPIYSLAYTQVEPVHLKNLQALSKNSFGKYFPIIKSVEKMTRAVEDIQHILQNDYVVTLRSYLEIDGKQHRLKIGVEYPSRSGKMRYQTDTFEAIQPPPVDQLISQMGKLSEALEPLPDRNPYLDNPFEAPLGPPVSAATSTSE